MNINRRFLHNRDLFPVILPLCSADEQQDPNLEPQLVKLRAPNHGRIYLDSTKPVFEANANNIRISSAVSPTDRASNLLELINRVCVSRFDMYWLSQNVNPVNNTYTWTLVLTTGPIPYTFTNTIPPGQYTLTNLLTTLTNQMTADANGVGLVGSFTFTVNPDGVTAVINNGVASTTFIFNDQSPLVKNGGSLLGLPKMTAPATTSLALGPARMLYSRYVDVVSQDLCSYVKNPNKSINRINQDIVFRQYLDEPSPSGIYRTIVKNLNWLNWNYDSPLAVINFQLLDEHGSLFYIPPAPEGTQATLNWTMELIIES